MLESGKVMHDRQTFLDRGAPNPLFGGFGGSNLVEGTIKKVHTDESNNVTFTCDVVTQKGEQKQRVPLLFPYANAVGRAGIWAVPNENDRCIIALGAGNTAYILGFHAAPQLSDSRATPTLGKEAPKKATFGSTQLVPGAIELRTTEQNRILLHPGGSILIDAKTDLFTFYDSISGTIRTLTRNMTITTAGGQMLWLEKDEKAQRSMEFIAQLFTKSATQENLDKGELRGGAGLQVIFSETAKHFFIEVKDSNNITSRIQMGPDGVILTAGNGTNQGSIAVSPAGNFLLIAGNPSGKNTKLSLAPDAIAIAAFQGSSPMATVVAETNGKVTLSSQQEVKVESPKVTIQSAQVITQGGRTNLGSPGGLGVARQNDPVVGSCSTGAISGIIVGASSMVTAL
jgi:hypothetical protein